MKKSMKEMLSNGRQAITVTVVLMLLCGFLFPVAMTGLSSLLFPGQAKGSIIKADGKAVGSAHVGQEFTEDYYMWGRPSAYHYNVYQEKDGGKYYNDGTAFAGLGSGSQNLSPTNPELTKRVEADMEEFLKRNPDVKKEDIPTDLLTASGSGLDPDISPKAARIQIKRIAKASGLSEKELEKIVEENQKGRLFGVFGEETVNVLKVNLEIAKKMGKIG